jgi:hypothetical protein
MASFVAVNKAVAGVVMDAKMAVVDDLVAYLESKIEVDDDLRAMFDEFKSNLKESEEKVVKDAGKKVKSSKKTASGEEKKKRAPSVFNLYVKDVMPEMKAKHPDIKDGKQMIGFASESWKSDPKASFIKEKVLEMKGDDKDGDVVEMYAKAKALWNDENGISSDEKVVEVKKTQSKEEKMKGKASKKEKSQSSSAKHETDDESDEKEKAKGKKASAKKDKSDDESEEKPKGKKAGAKKVVKESDEEEEDEE